MGIDVIDVILCVQRNDTTLSHMFLLPTRTWDLGGILTNRVDGCRTELRSVIENDEREQIITYIGIDEIDVILCVQRIATTLSHMFLLPTRTWDLGGIFTNRVDGCCTELRSAME